MPTALVTGITGQDGSYLAEKLTAEGVGVHGLVRAGDSQLAAFRELCPDAQLHTGDLVDAAGLARLIDDLEPDEIYNLAGVSSVALSWEKPLLTASVTGLGAASILEAGWRLQERLGRPVRVLQASSAEMFGFPDDVPQTERTTIRPRTPYGAAKAFAHHLVGVYRGRGLSAVSCILYNHESPRRPTTFVTRKITHAAAMIAAGKQDQLSLGNLNARRDWGWAPDYVDAMCRALRHHNPDDYLIATGESHTVGEFVAAAFARAGIADRIELIRVDESLGRPGDAPEQVGSSAKARAVLGWRPTIGFTELVERMVEADLREVGLASS